MQYSILGSTGMRVSRICLGCMSYGSTALDIELSAEEIAALEAPYLPHPVKGLAPRPSMRRL